MRISKSSISDKVENDAPTIMDLLPRLFLPFVWTIHWFQEDLPFGVVLNFYVLKIKAKVCECLKVKVIVDIYDTWFRLNVIENSLVSDKIWDCSICYSGEKDLWFVAYQLAV